MLQFVGGDSKLILSRPIWWSLATLGLGCHSLKPWRANYDQWWEERLHERGDEHHLLTRGKILWVKSQISRLRRLQTSLLLDVRFAQIPRGVKNDVVVWFLLVWSVFTGEYCGVYNWSLSGHAPVQKEVIENQIQLAEWFRRQMTLRLTSQRDSSSWGTSAHLLKLAQRTLRALGRYGCRYAMEHFVMS